MNLKSNDDIFPLSHFISAISKSLKFRLFVTVWHGINDSMAALGQALPAPAPPAAGAAQGSQPPAAAGRGRRGSRAPPLPGALRHLQALGSLPSARQPAPDSLCAPSGCGSTLPAEQGNTWKFTPPRGCPQPAPTGSGV